MHVWVSLMCLYKWHSDTKIQLINGLLIFYLHTWDNTNSNVDLSGSFTVTVTSSQRLWVFYINRDIIILVLLCRQFLREDNFHVGIINSQIRLFSLNTKMMGKEKCVVKTCQSAEVSCGWKIKSGRDKTVS